MSLNDYFAANGAVYLRPMAMPDCFPMPGLPHGCKPPPLPMQHPCNPPQKPRTMAAVSPLHQVVQPQPNLPSYEGGNMAPFSSASRTSSFAAALRKLAKQAGDPVSGEKDLSQISPVASPVLNQGPLPSKRTVQNGPPAPNGPMFLTNNQVSYASSPPPPIVTIAPSRPIATHTTESRKVMDLNGHQGSNSSNMSNGHLQESMGVKMDSSKGGPRPAHSEKWEESNLSNKGMSGTSASSQVRPHATIAPLPRPDDSLTSSRGFQPYRSTEEPRNTLPHHLPLFEHHHPAASSYPYSPAFLPPPHLSHPAYSSYRFDDPLYLERYSLLRPPVMPYPQPSMMAPAAFYPNTRYAADLIAQSLSINSATNSMLNERLKQEEERRIREKELELDQSRSKEQERQREKEHREKETREREHKEREKEKREKSHREKDDHSEHKKGMHNNSYSNSTKRTESPSVRNPPIIHSTPNHITSSTTVTNSLPLNLVVQSGLPESHKKEAELWVPWQQPFSTHAKDTNQELSKHPVFRPQDTHRHHFTKDTASNDKSNTRFSPPFLNEKRQPSLSNNESSSNEPKKHSSSEFKRVDASHHQHNAEPTTHKEHGPHEWRHEKLQKACTNNHRKSHESKKAKEERNHQNHQRELSKIISTIKPPAVNGAILKSTPFHNEGMHARLLESEKCRLEMNGHALPKIPAAISNDRLAGASHKSSHPPQPVKELSPQNSITDFFSAPLLKSNVETTPVVSKLDFEANVLKEGKKICDDDAKEEIRLRNFLLLSKIPPAKMENVPQKLNFLKLLGLTTHLKRKKIELDMYIKRRKILREDSVVIETHQDMSGDEKEIEPPPPCRTNAHLSEQLRLEVTPAKWEFFLQIGLKPLPLIQKEEKERIRVIIEDEKRRRLYRLSSKDGKKSIPRRLFVPKSEAAKRLDHLRKLREMKSNGLIARNFSEDEKAIELKYAPNRQLIAPKTESVPYQCSEDSNELENNHSIFSSSEEDVDETSSSLTYRSNKYSWKRGHSLKHEFRFVSSEHSSKYNHCSRTNGQVVRTEASLRTSTSSIGIQVDPSSLACSGEKSSTETKSSQSWPNLEAIMEAFYKLQSEQSSEKTMLLERCHKMQKTQDELKNDADGLSRYMSELLRTKRELDEEKQRHQKSIDHLKKCLLKGR